ncbi:MAG: glycosyltransferase family 2 protein [Patescibacteria group bacterium]
MKIKKIVSIILTSYNEEKNIGRTIKDCKTLQKFFPIEIIVVDAASKDKTIEIAKKMRVDRIIQFPFKRGKGADFWVAGCVAKGDYIIQIDADHQFQPYEIPLFVDSLNKRADIVIGTRFGGGKIEKGSVSFRNLFGNWLMSLATSIACGRRITDVMAGFKGFRREAFLALDLQERHFEYEAETVTKAVKMGMNLEQIPITYTKRVGGVSGIKAIRDGLNVCKAIVKVYFSNLPNYHELFAKSSLKHKPHY